MCYIAFTVSDQKRRFPDLFSATAISRHEIFAILRHDFIVRGKEDYFKSVENRAVI